MPTSALSRWGLALVAGGMGVVACSGRLPAELGRRPGPSTGLSPTTTTTRLPPSPLGLPVNPIGWLACGSLQCGTVAVPLDYAHPNGRVIGIAVARHPATNPAGRLGSLVINPGGPGDSGINDLPTELRVLTPDVVAAFDIVSFDPRGVERSSPVRCTSTSSPHSTGTAVGPLSDPVPQTLAAQQALLAADRAYGQACQNVSGDLLPFVGTVDVARDLDRIRAALGDTQLSFLGHSYGTLLGAIYADMFPTHVRAMVLDGPIDPALSLDQMSLDQAKGFEAILNRFFQWCLTTSSCPWRPASAPRDAFLALFNGVRAQPLRVGGRSVSGGEFYSGVLSTLYAQSFWPSLGRALAAAQRGDGSQLLALSDGYQSHGGSNAVDANAAITCADHPASHDLSTYPQVAAANEASAPFFGPIVAWGALECAPWPVEASRSAAPVRASGSPPILVVATTDDPATPYAWGQALARELQHGVLLIRRGADHVAYYYSACVRSDDARYLLHLEAPVSGTICSS